MKKFSIFAILFLSPLLLFSASLAFTGNGKKAEQVSISNNHLGPKSEEYIGSENDENTNPLLSQPEHELEEDSKLKNLDVSVNQLNINEEFAYRKKLNAILAAGGHEDLITHVEFFTTKAFLQFIMDDLQVNAAIGPYGNRADYEQHMGHVIHVYAKHFLLLEDDETVIVSLKKLRDLGLQLRQEMDQEKRNELIDKINEEVEIGLNALN